MKKLFILTIIVAAIVVTIEAEALNCPQGMMESCTTYDNTTTCRCIW